MWWTYFQLVSYIIHIAYIIPENVAFEDFHMAFIASQDCNDILNLISPK